MVIEAKGVRGSSRSIQYQQSDKEKGASQEIMRNGIISDEPKEIHKEFSAIEKQYQRSNFSNKRIEIVISPDRRNVKNFSREDWEDLAKKSLEKVGINHKNHPYIGHLHTSTNNPHLHLKISRINFQGKNAISTEDIGAKFGKAANQIAKEKGWKNAKEIGQENRMKISNNINEVLQKEKVKDFEEFKSAMGERGYSVKLSQNEAKGVYGMRIIAQEQEVDNPSPRLAKSGQGYKLSEIEKAEVKKAKFNISDLKAKFQMNQIIAERERFNKLTPEEKIKFAQEKNAKIFGTKVHQEQAQEKREEKTQERKPDQVQSQQYSQFDKMKAQREEKSREQEQNREERRGFRR